MTISASGSSRSKTESGPSLSDVTTNAWPAPQGTAAARAPRKRCPKARPARSGSARGSASSDRRSSARSWESPRERTTSDTLNRIVVQDTENLCHLCLTFLARPWPGPADLDSVGAVREVERRPRDRSAARRLSPEGRAAAVPARLPRLIGIPTSSLRKKPAGIVTAGGTLTLKPADERADSRGDREMETLTQMKCVACRKDEPTVAGRRDRRISSPKSLTGKSWSSMGSNASGASSHSTILRRRWNSRTR